METQPTTRHSRWLPVIVGLLGLVVLLQVALLFQRQARPEPDFGFFTPAPRAASWWDRTKARVQPARAEPAPAPLTPDTVWGDFHRMEHMHAQISRMFEEAFEMPGVRPPGVAAVSNVQAGSNAFLDPVRHMHSLRRQIDAMFATARSDSAGLRTGFEDGWSALSITPGLTVRDTGDTYEVSVPLPGFDKSAIHVTFDGSVLDIVAEQRRESADAGRTNATWTTRATSRFERRLLLPEAAAAPGAIQATYRDDVLHVSVPKAKPEQDEDRLVPVI